MSIPALFLTASVSMTSAPGAVIDKLFDSFNRHDVAALQALYSPNARLTSSDFCKPRTGVDVARTYGALGFAPSPIFEMTWMRLSLKAIAPQYAS